MEAALSSDILVLSVTSKTAVMPTGTKTSGRTALHNKEFCRLLGYDMIKWKGLSKVSE
jgi:hypothetical protein